MGSTYEFSFTLLPNGCLLCSDALFLLCAQSIPSFSGAFGLVRVFRGVRRRVRPVLGVARLHTDSKDDDKQQLLVLQELLQPLQGGGCRRLRRLRSGRRASAAVEAARAMAARCAAAPPLPDPNGDAVGAIGLHTRLGTRYIILHCSLVHPVLS